MWLDRLFRKDMYDRFVFTLARCEPIRGRTFWTLVVARASISVELARRGAAHVIGLDIAPRMLELSRRAASEANVADRCTFLHTDLLAYGTDAQVDVTIAIGLFDYLADPLPVLRRMQEVSRDRAIISFPRVWTWRAPVRRMRLGAKGLDVYFYRRSRLNQLLARPGFTTGPATRIGKLHCAVAFATAS